MKDKETDGKLQQLSRSAAEAKDNPDHLGMLEYVDLSDLAAGKEPSRTAAAAGNAAASSDPVIHMEKIIKRYYIGTENELEVLHGIDLDVHKGELTSIVGESGSGKSTLMNIIGLLDHPTDGVYEFGGEDVLSLKDRQLSMLRNEEIGFVFQTYNLIARMSALHNVEVPMMYARVPAAERRDRAEELLEMVGMQERMDHTPDELSGGQKQRVAIARALANDPSIILADEPTGALDQKTSHQIMDIFHRMHDEENRTILIITHSQALSEETNRILTISDGRIVGERKGSNAG